MAKANHKEYGADVNSLSDEDLHERLQKADTRIVTYKGTDKDMKCRGMQYELGKTEKSDGAIRCGDKGFHSCEAPLDVLRYYPLRDGNRFFVTEAAGQVDRRDARDSKLASSELTLKAEVGVKGLIQAHFEYTRKKAESGNSGGADSNLAGGDWSNLAGGARSNLAGGASSLIVGRNGCKVKAGLHSVLVLTEWVWKDGEHVPVCVKAEIVDGENIKADTWYTLHDGKLEVCE